MSAPTPYTPETLAHAALSSLTVLAGVRDAGVVRPHKGIAGAFVFTVPQPNGPVLRVIVAPDHLE